MCGLFVERQHFELLVREVEDRAARGLIDAVVLHADEPVLDDVKNADAVCAAELVELRDDLGDLHLFAVHGYGHARFKVDGNFGCHIGRLIGRDAHLEELVLIEVRLVCRVFEVQALMAQVPEVLILGVVRLSRDFQRHMVRFGVVDLFISRLDLPLSPRRDDRHAGGKILNAELKADLIVTLAGAAVGNCVRAFGERDLGQLLGDDGSCKRRAEQVFFVLCAHHDRRHDDIVAHLVREVGHDQLARAGLDGLFLETFELVALPHVGGNGNDFRIVVVFLQPGNNDRCIQTAGIGENDFLDGFLFHGVASVCHILWINIISFCIKMQYTSCTNPTRIFLPFCIYRNKFCINFCIYVYLFVCNEKYTGKRLPAGIKHTLFSE